MTKDRIMVVCDVAYRNDAHADKAKHKLDVFLPPTDQETSLRPAENASRPVILFVHGTKMVLCI